MENHTCTPGSCTPMNCTAMRRAAVEFYGDVPELFAVEMDRETIQGMKMILRLSVVKSYGCDALRQFDELYETQGFGPAADYLKQKRALYENAERMLV